MLIYRYRTSANYHIEALLNNQINGSLYFQFKDVGELNLSISDEAWIDGGLPLEWKQPLLDSIINHIRSSFYMACFTKVSPAEKESASFWKQYANNGTGFCVEYRTEDIQRAIQGASPEFTRCLKEVIYSSEPHDLADFFIALSKALVSVQEKNHQTMTEALYSQDKDIGHMVTQSLIWKSSEYYHEREVRLTALCNNTSGPVPPIHRNDLLCVRPSRVFVSKRMNDLDQDRIFSYCNANRIVALTIDPSHLVA